MIALSTEPLQFYYINIMYVVSYIFYCLFIAEETTEAHFHIENHISPETQKTILIGIHPTVVWYYVLDHSNPILMENISTCVNNISMQCLQSEYILSLSLCLRSFRFYSCATSRRRSADLRPPLTWTVYMFSALEFHLAHGCAREAVRPMLSDTAQ